MTSSPQYNIGGIGGYPMDWNAIMSNPYFMMAASSPNVNFKANTESASQSGAAQNTNSVSNNSQNAAAQSVVSQPQEQQQGSGFAQSALAVTLIGAGAYALFRGHKSGYLEKMWKKFTGKSDNKTVNTVLQNLTAVKNGNGEIKIQVPNKTKTFAGVHVNSGAEAYGVKGAISAEKLAFNPEVSAARGFQLDTPIGRYTVFMKDGKVSKIIEGHKNVYEEFANAEAKTTNAELFEKFKKIAAELGKDPKEVDKDVLKDVVNIGFINKYGDDTLKLTMSKYGETPQLKAFNTLKQFSKDDVAVMQYKPSSSERIFAGDLVKKTGWINQKGVLAEGLEVIRCEENIAGAKCFFENGKLVKILQDGNEYTAESLGFDKFVKANEKAIEQFKKDVFVDKIAAKIPVGSIIGTV